MVVSAIGGPAGKNSESELLRKRVNAEAARAKIAVMLPEGARTLQVTLDAGEYGPVQDKLVLHRAALLVDKK